MGGRGQAASPSLLLASILVDDYQDLVERSLCPVVGGVHAGMYWHQAGLEHTETAGFVFFLQALSMLFMSK